MTKLLERLISYIVNNKPEKAITAKEALYTIYLCDWKSAIEREGKTFSKLNYKLQGNDLISDAYIKALKEITNRHVNSNEMQNIILNDLNFKNVNLSLPLLEKKYLDFVVDFLEKNGISAQSAAESSYPIFSYHGNDEEKMNLELLAEDYRNHVRPKIKEKV